MVMEELVKPKMFYPSESLPFGRRSASASGAPASLPSRCPAAQSQPQAADARRRGPISPPFGSPLALGHVWTLSDCLIVMN